VNGLLNADGATGNFSSNVSGTGTINTVNDTTLNVVGVLEGITHTGGTLATADGSSLSVVNGTLRNVTNSSGVLGVVDSTLEGQITNQAGARIIAGSGADVIKVSAATRLFNEGVIDGSLTVGDGGILSGSGILSGNLDIFSGGTFLSDNITDPFNVEGTATLAGELQFDWFDLDLNGDPLTPIAGDFIDLMYANTIIGEFDLLTLALLGDGLGWQLDYLTDEIGSLDVARLSVVSAVPVPAAVWLFGSGFLGLVGIARRKKA
jgi:hypothetical protein